MKFKTYLETISGVSIYPMISLILFTLIFGYVIFSTVRLKKNDIEEKSQLPLD